MTDSGPSFTIQLAGLGSLAAELSTMGTWNCWSASISRVLVFAATLALVSCSGGGSGGRVEPPPPPPLDPAKFQVALGGAGSESPTFVAATAMGGALIVGSTDSYGAGNGDVWLVETDDVGTILRQRTWGGSEHDEPTSVDRTTDGGVVLGVATYAEGGDRSTEIVALDDEWNLHWRQPAGYAQVRALRDGDVAIVSPDLGGTGLTTLARLAPNGEERWRLPLVGWGYESPAPIAEGPDGDLYVAGGVSVARVSHDGALRWVSEIDPSPWSYSAALRTLVIQSDGAVSAAGYTSHLNGHHEYSNPLFATISPDGATASAHDLEGMGSERILAAVAEANGELTLLGSHSLVRVTADGSVLGDRELPFAPTAFATVPSGRFIVAPTEDYGRGQADALLAKLDEDDLLGDPPAPESIPPATSFGAVEPIADLGEYSAPLWIRATSDASSPPLVAWWPDPDGSGQAPLDSARRTSKGRWDSLPLAPAGQGGPPVALTAAGSGRALAVWLGELYFGPLIASNLDPRAGWNTSFTRLDPDLGDLSIANLPRLASNARGQGVAVWEQWAFGTGVLGARWFDPHTGGWGPASILPDSASTGTLQNGVAIDAEGQATVVRMGAFELSALRGDASGAWQNLGPFVRETDPLRSVELTSGGNAEMLATWTVYNDSGTGLRTAWLRDGKLVAPPITLSGVRTLTAEPIVTCVDRDAHALVAWVDDYTVFATEGASGAAWSVPVAHPDEEARGASLAGVASLGHGEFLVSWFERRGSRGTAWASRYHRGGTWEKAEFLGDALGGYVVQTAGTVAWLAPTHPGTALVARTAR